jgi:hypothetical protein
MAYKLGSINPLDLKPSTAIGVSIPFDNQSVFKSVYTTADQLKYNIINYLVTDKRERLFFPNFGADLRRQLFEQMTSSSLGALEFRISEELQAYFPQIEVTELGFKPDPNQNLLTFSLVYGIRNTGKSDEILINYATNG